MAREKDNGFVRLEKLEGGFSDLYFFFREEGLSVFIRKTIYTGTF